MPATVMGPPPVRLARREPLPSACSQFTELNSALTQFATESVSIRVCAPVSSPVKGGVTFSLAPGTRVAMAVHRVRTGEALRPVPGDVSRQPRATSATSVPSSWPPNDP